MDDNFISQEEPHWENGLHLYDLDLQPDLSPTSVIDLGLNHRLARSSYLDTQADSSDYFDLFEQTDATAEQWLTAGALDASHATQPVCGTPVDSVIGVTISKPLGPPQTSITVTDYQIQLMELELEAKRSMAWSRYRPTPMEGDCSRDGHASKVSQKSIILPPPEFSLPPLHERTMKLAAEYREHPDPLPDRPFARQRSRRCSSSIRGHRSRGAYPCEECHEAFDLPSDLKHHFRKHIPNADRPYPCSECSDRFLYPKDLRRHQGRKHCPVDESSVAGGKDQLDSNPENMNDASTARPRAADLNNPSRGPDSGPSRKRQRTGIHKPDEDPFVEHEGSHNSATRSQLRQESAQHKQDLTSLRCDRDYLEYFAPPVNSLARIETFSRYQQTGNVPQAQISRAWLQGLQAFFPWSGPPLGSGRRARIDQALECLTKELDRLEIEACFNTSVVDDQDGQPHYAQG